MRAFLDDLFDSMGMPLPGSPAPPPPRAPADTGRRVYRYTLRDGTVVSVETTSPEPYVRAAALRAVARSLDP